MTRSCIISTSSIAPLRHAVGIVLLITGTVFHTTAQTVTVRSIHIEGIKKTKPVIINRELTFAVGDTLPQMQLGQILERNRDNLLNMGIFNEALVNIIEWDTDVHEVDILVQVRESWYIYALPIIDLADRNFNVWWTTYNHSFDRLNLGGRLDWLNFSGRNDKLNLELQVGYTPKQEIEYELPYLDKRQQLGIKTSFLHSTRKETAYATIGNREQFIKLDDRKLYERWFGEVSLQYRPAIIHKHEFGVSLQHIAIDPEVISDYNPIYFRKGGDQHNAVGLRYTYEYDDRDFKIYAEKGIRAFLEVEKIGLSDRDDENSMVAKLAIEWNKASGRRFQHRLVSLNQYSLSRKRPSYMHFIGLGDSRYYIRGYELYLVDGLDYVVGKYQLAFMLLDKKIRLGKMIFVEEFRTMPVQVYASLFVEGGYVHDPFTATQNPLANQWLHSVGPGIDVVVYHNFLFQANLSRNHLGEWGLFLHNRTSF